MVYENQAINSDSARRKRFSEKLKRLSLERETLKRYSYCGDISIEKMEYVGNASRERIIKVGIDNHAVGEGTIWKILEY